MIFKRLILLCLCLFTPSLLLASSEATHYMTPDQAMAELTAGNVRYYLGQSAHPNISFSRRLVTVTEGQTPFATVIACSDSRVPVEILFDQGVGDLFVIKVAGNVADVDEIGSAEYGVDHLGTPVLMVLGHSHCGAVTAVVSGAEVHGSIPQLVDNIVPVATAMAHAHPAMDKNALVDITIEANIWQAVADLLTKSPAIAARAAHGKVLVVGAHYDLLTGKVRVLGPHPKQDELLASAGLSSSSDHAAATDAAAPEQHVPAAEAPAHQPEAAATPEAKPAAHAEAHADAQPVKKAAPAASTATTAAPENHAEKPAVEPAKAHAPEAAAHAEEKPSSGRFGFFSFIGFVLLLIGAVMVLDKKILNPEHD